MRSSLILIFRLLLALLAFSLLVTALNMMGVPNPFYNPFSRPAAIPRPVTPAPSDLGGDERNTIEVFKRVSPSVVYITNTELRRRGLFSLDAMSIPTGTGSGFVWDHQGHIVTNYHVVSARRGANVQNVVTLHDRSAWNAQIIGHDADYDLAVLRVGAPNHLLQPVMIGSSADLQVGQKAIAIGNPFGLDLTLTTGVISALGRSIESVNGRTIFDVIQTDAAINPGNSGGPLLDTFGRMIGVNTAIISPSGSSAGIGFAVPVDTVNRIVPQLISQGRIARPFIGVEMLPNHLRREFNVEGVVITRVEPGSPASQAGLQGLNRDEDGRFQLGDVIVRLEGETIRGNDDLLRFLEQYAPGDTVSLTILRDSATQEISMILGRRS